MITLYNTFSLGDPGVGHQGFGGEADRHGATAEQHPTLQAGLQGGGLPPCRPHLRRGP